MEELREYRTIAEPCTIEQVIKKSKFYGRLYPAESMEQAQEILDGLKKQFWDASHNCSAMIFGQMREFSRCSDDGEPQGTAGMPMLETLRGSGLTNILAVVTRYFGGTLLGTGGLVRAYGSSVSLALQAARKICYKPRVVFSLELPFRLWGKAEWPRATRLARCSIRMPSRAQSFRISARKADWPRSSAKFRRARPRQWR